MPKACSQVLRRAFFRRVQCHEQFLCPAPFGLGNAMITDPFQVKPNGVVTQGLEVSGFAFLNFADLSSAGNPA